MQPPGAEASAGMNQETSSGADGQDIPSAEEARLAEDALRERNWKRWGPYLSERQWGTVREDYSPDGSAWEFFPHDHARSRAYRWGEDGLLGITDRECRLCFGLALWNGQDPILKERLFGLTNSEGNHGEDVKECYYYLDSTPTHSYLKGLYKYPQRPFPYRALVEVNAQRDYREPEFELEDSGVFEGDRYWDVTAEYAKAGPDDLLICITVANRGPEPATLHLLPTLWFRNTWSWGCDHEGCWPKPWMRGFDGESGDPSGAVRMSHVTLGEFEWIAGPGAEGAAPELLFTENESNLQRLWDTPNASPYVKDAFHRYLIEGQQEAVNPRRLGTKVAAHYPVTLSGGGETTVCLRLRSTNDAVPVTGLGDDFEGAFQRCKKEADEFYACRLPANATPDEARVIRQAYAGLLWTKQFYQYGVSEWLKGDPDQPAPPPARELGRNSDWTHLFNRDVISMPDKWEYPWYAAWDLAFHMIPFAKVDPQFAKDQLVLFLREWYMHPNGQIPAYEWALGDVNPPVHAWAAWRVYKLTGERGHRDRLFLERVFQKLLINFTWWVNRKDVGGRHLFAGGFLGLDNIGLFDRSRPLPGGGHLEQADGTAWMAFYCSTMLSMALELAVDNPAYEDSASKFFEHFIAIVDAMNHLGGDGLWDEQDGFYYDRLRINDEVVPLRVRSMVGLIPLFAVEVLDIEQLKHLPGFTKRMQWFMDNRKDLARHIAYLDPDNGADHPCRLLAIPSRERLERVLRYLLDEQEFLSPYGVRSLSRIYKDRPYSFELEGVQYGVNYVPGESETGMFGGNSNWRGPIWMPVNYLLIEALERYGHFYGETLKVECPTGSGNWMNLTEVARDIARRLDRIFLPDETGRCAWQGAESRYRDNPHWKELVLFHEYFDGDTGRGVGATHQTGWTSLIVRLLEDR